MVSQSQTAPELGSSSVQLSEKTKEKADAVDNASKTVGDVSKTTTNAIAADSNAVAAAPTKDPTVPLTEEELAKQEEENKKTAAEEKQKADRLARRRKWRGKKCMILSVYFFCVIVGLLCTTKWFLLYDEYGSPPSDYAHDASNHGLMAYIGLAVLAAFGFIILSFKISNMFIGMFFMFCIILVCSFSLKGTSRSAYSYVKDDIDGTMKLFYKDRVKEGGAIPEFFNKLQAECKCCGIREIDRLLDWPTQVESPDFPGGCCKGYKTKDDKDGRFKDAAVVQCKGLGRMYNQTRVPGGFTIIADPTLMIKWYQGNKIQDNKPIVPLQAYRLSKLQDNFTDDTHKETFKTHSWELIKANYSDSIKAFFNNQKGVLNNAANIPPSELMVLLDTDVEELLDEAVKHDLPLKRGEWLYFEIPVESFISIKANGDASGKANYKVYYVTKGLAESIMMQDVIHERRCETLLEEPKTVASCKYLVHKKKSKTRKKLGEIFTSIRRKLSSKNATNKHLVFFQKIMKEKIMVWIGSMSAAILVCVVTLAIIFWYYYSRLKAEEQAGLVPPTDFNLLHLDLPSYEELDEVTKKMEQELLKTRLQEQHNRILAEQRHRTTDQRRRKKEAKWGGTTAKESKEKDKKKRDGENKPSKGKGGIRNNKVAPGPQPKPKSGKDKDKGGKGDKSSKPKNKENYEDTDTKGGS